MREDQRGIQFHPAAVPLVSISLSFLAYFPFSLFFLAVLAPVSRAFLFFFSSHPFFFFVFFRLPRRVSSNFHDYSRRRVFLCTFPSFSLAADFRRRGDYRSIPTIRCMFYVRFITVYTSKNGTLLCVFFIYSVSVCIHYSFINL